MVIILLGEGFEETEALTPANLLRRAGIEVSLVGLTGRQVTGGHGIIVPADQTLEELDQNLDLNQVEMLVLPGGGQGTASIQRNERALGLIQQCWDHGCFLGAICAAPTILGAMGILDRRKAVCYPGMEDRLGSGVYTGGRPIVVDGHLVTGRAAGAVFDFGLKLVEVLRGVEAARRVRYAVYYRGEQF